MATTMYEAERGRFWETEVPLTAENRILTISHYPENGKLTITKRIKRGADVFPRTITLDSRDITPEMRQLFEDFLKVTK